MTSSAVAFDEEHAAIYDRRFAKLAPMKDALHLCARALLSDLPRDANILCVGAGTGSELINLAEAFPDWRFTAVDPSTPMLDICRQRAERAGLGSRCTFHDGYLESLPASEPFDAATAFLVSHFCVRTEDRRDFFRQIAARLRDGGRLVSADIAGGPSAAARESLLPPWWEVMRQADSTEEQIAAMAAAYGRDVSLLTTGEVEAIIASAGFEAPVLFLQTLLIHGWFARRG